MWKILLIFCLLYWVLVGMAKKRYSTYPLSFGFLAGWAVAFFCFAFLPTAFCGDGYLFAIGATGIGIFCGILSERFPFRHLWEGIGFTAAALFFLYLQRGENLSFWQILFTAWLGGYGLYLASGVILPEQGEKREAFFSALGGLIGFLLGTFFRFMA